MRVVRKAKKLFRNPKKFFLDSSGLQFLVKFVSNSQRYYIKAKIQQGRYRKQNKIIELIGKKVEEDQGVIEDIEKPYYSIKIKEKDAPTIVAFSSRNVKPGNFNYYKSDFEEGNLNRIMFNCKDNSWYLDGVEEFSDNFQHTVEKIYDLLKSHSSRALFIGSSMGGYAALLYGTLCKAERIVCFGTEIITALPGGFTTGNLPYFNKNTPFCSLDSYIKDSPSRIDLIIGECSPADIYSAFYVRKYPNVRIHLIKNSGHAVVQSLKNKDLLVDVVNCGIKNVDLNIDKDLYLEEGELLDYIQSYNYQMKDGNFNEFVDGYISISLKAHREKQDYEFYFEYLLKAKFYVLAYKVLEELESKYGKVQDIQIKKARLLYKQNKYLEIMGLEGLDESEEYLYFKALAARRLNDKPEFLMAMEKGMKIATSNKNKPLLKAFYKVEPLV